MAWGLISNHPWGPRVLLITPEPQGYIFQSGAFDPQADVPRSQIYEGFVPVFQRKLPFRPRDFLGGSLGGGHESLLAPQESMGAFWQVRRSSKKPPDTPPWAPAGPHGAPSRRRAQIFFSGFHNFCFWDVLRFKFQLYGKQNNIS